MTAQPRVAIHQTIASRTQRVYDRLARVYPASTYFFHSKAHRTAIEMSGLQNGMRVLEIATGSGEMFRRLLKANPNGYTCGVDLSPKMAARTQEDARRQFPKAKLHCQAVDARALPFRDGAFDAVFCCYLFELLGHEDIVLAMDEIARVCKTKGRLTTILIGQQAELFNKAYKVAGSLVPAFWGRQVDKSMNDVVSRSGFRIHDQREIRQGFYPSRIVTATRSA